MPYAAHRISSSSSKRSTLRCVLTGAATAFLLSSATVYSNSLKIAVVADEGCPLVIRDARVERADRGIVVVYTLLNEEDQHVKHLVLTAASVDWLGGVIQVRMAPIDAKIPKRSSGEYRVAFPDLELRDADRLVFGIQAVQWSGRRAEWRAALTLAGPAAVARR